MVKFNRGERRFQRERLMVKRSGYYGGYSKDLAGKKLSRLLSLWARTAQVCSCFMCGNPRRHEKAVTVQEKRANLYSCRTE